MHRDPSPFQLLESAFQALGAEPAPLVVDSREVGNRLPRRPMPVTELRSLLLHPSMDFRTRSATLRYVLGRARADGGAWTLALAGLVLPGVRKAVGPFIADAPQLAGDIEAEAVTGLVEAVTSGPVGERVAASLVWAAARRAHRLVNAECVEQVGRATAPSASTPHAPWGHPDFVLARAVAAGVISDADADLIGETRLGDVPLAAYARQHGIAYDTTTRRRHRAERRLVGWLRENAG